jgi:hypothetical protein
MAFKITEEQEDGELKGMLTPNLTTLVPCGGCYENGYTMNETWHFFVVSGPSSVGGGWSALERPDHPKKPLPEGSGTN